MAEVGSTGSTPPSCGGTANVAMIWQSSGAGLCLEGKLEHSLAILTLLVVKVGATTRGVVYSERTWNTRLERK